MRTKYLQNNNLGPLCGVIMEGLTGSLRGDPVAQKFASALGPQLGQELAQSWSRLRPRDRTRLMAGFQPQGTSFERELKRACEVVAGARSKARDIETALVVREVDAALRAGLFSHPPSAAILARPNALRRYYAEIAKYHTSPVADNDCCPEEPLTQDPQLRKKVGVKFKNFTCQRESDPTSAHDEYYFLWSTINDANAVTVGISPLYGGVDENEKRSVERWIYPPQPAGSFLSVTMECWEEDGGWKNVAQYVTQIGAAASSIPNIYSVIAGAGISVAGAIIGLFADNNGDDFVDDWTKDWFSLPDGTKSLSPVFYGRTHGNESWVVASLQMKITYS